MIEKTLTYEADGKKLVSTLYRKDPTAPAPAIIVFPDIRGLGDHARERAARLAELGYIALAADLHGDAELIPPETVMSVLDGFYAHVAGPLERGRASLAALCGEPGVDPTRIGAMGFCYGGTLALELARSGADLAAVVGFHSALATTIAVEPGGIRAKVLACIGAEDPIVPPDDRARFEEEMRQAKVDWRLHLYGGVLHSFTDWRADLANLPGFAKYDASADRQSWIAMADLFQEVFGPN